MTNQSHFCDSTESAALYVAGAMSEQEAAAFESHLAECMQCAAEFRRLSPVAENLLAVVEPMVPNPRVLDRLQARIRSAAAGVPTSTRDHLSSPADPPQTPVNPQVWKQWDADPLGEELLVRRAGEGQWELTGISGIEIRRLFMDPARNQMTALVRMGAGATYPRHLHNGPEECYVLQGRLNVGDTVLSAGDYQYAPAGSRHPVQSTRDGCLLLIVSSLTDDIEP